MKKTPTLILLTTSVVTFFYFQLNATIDFNDLRLMGIIGLIQLIVSLWSWRKLNIIEVYEKTSLFILSSRMEATPLVLIESQSFGIPVICFDHLSSVKEIASDSVMYADFDDSVESLKNSIEMIIDSERVYSEYSRESKLNVLKFNKVDFRSNWLEVIKK